MNKSKKILGFLLIFSLVVFMFGCTKKVAAVVNGQEIYQQDFDEVFNPIREDFENRQAGIFEGEEGKQMLQALKEQVIQQMINQAILTQEAKQQGVFPENKEINQKIEEIKASYSSEKEFNQFLEDNNIQRKELVDFIGLEMAQVNLMEKVTKDITVTEEEVKEYFEENKESFHEPEKVRVRHILIGIKDESNPAGANFKLDQKQAKNKAQELLQQIKQGKDFAELAKGESEDLGTKEQGGLLDPFSENDNLVPEFIEASFNLEEGQVSDLVKTDYGYHIIKLEEKIAAKSYQYEDIKLELTSQLEQSKKLDEFYHYMEKVTQNAKIKNNIIAEDKQKEDINKGDKK